MRFFKKIWSSVKRAVSFVWERAVRPGIEFVARVVGLNMEKVSEGLDRAEAAARSVVEVLERDFVELVAEALENSRVLVRGWLSRHLGGWGLVVDRAIEEFSRILDGSPRGRDMVPVESAIEQPSRSNHSREV